MTQQSSHQTRNGKTFLLLLMLMLLFVNCAASIGTLVWTVTVLNPPPCPRTDPVGDLLYRLQIEDLARRPR